MIDERTIFAKWLDEQLTKKGRGSKGRLAEFLNLRADAITRMLNTEPGKEVREAKPHELRKMAEFFGETPPGIIASTPGSVSERPELRIVETRMVSVPIIGKTEAGSFREVDDLDQSETDYLSLPPDKRFPGARQMAFDVEGDSMNDLKPRPILSGDRAICVAYEDVAHEATLRDGMVVVVERTRDGGHTREWSIKQVEIYANRVEFHPRSTNAKHKPIVIARDVEADDGTAVEIIALLRRVVNDYDF